MSTARDKSPESEYSSQMGESVRLESEREKITAKQKSRDPIK